MNPKPGQTVLHYQLIEKIGSGGMGVVYRALDTKLRRDVAIKVLPDDFGQDADRMARFEREAHVLASLNHPGIASIYGLEESDGVRFLVLELVPGETLADRLQRGPLPIDEAIEISYRIAEALEEAHENGIIHRDVKPANVKLTPDGKVKVLDFGLARPSGTGADRGDPSDSPTATVAETRPGMILGTAAYMSPEQARGRTLDRRADIWALGCCLYEMLAGKQAFRGDTVTDLFAEIVKSDPDWESLPQDTPARIRVLLWRCLQKDPKRRLRDIGEARFELGRNESDPLDIPVLLETSSLPRRINRKTTIVASAMTLIIGSVIASLVTWSAMRGSTPFGSTAQSVKRFEIDIGKTEPLPIAGISADLAVSPDGRRLAYVANVDGAKGLRLRDLDTGESTLVPGTENAWRPFFSPDGRWVGLFLPGSVSSGRGELVKIPAEGGPPVDLCSAFPPAGGTWLEDGSIIFTNQDSELDLTNDPFLSHLFRVDQNGGTPERLTVANAAGRDEITHCLPKSAPGQNFFLFTTVDSAGRFDAALFDLNNGQYEKILNDALGAQYVSSGHIVFVRDNALWAAKFDPESRTLGAVVAVQNNIQTNDRRSVAPFAVSQEGSLVYLPTVSAEDPLRTLVWVDHDGREETVAVPPGKYWWPRVSPDGSRVAMAILPVQDGNEDIWIHQFERAHSMIRFTFDRERDNNPTWSTDGKYVYYTSYLPGATALFRRRADGIGSVDTVLAGRETKYVGDITPDGGTLLFGRPIRESGWDIMECGLPRRDGGTTLGSAVQPLLDSEFNEGGVKLSPDGRWIAYNTDETNPTQVFVRPYPKVNEGRWQVSTDGGINPSWSADGKEIYYRNGARMMAVSVETEPTFRAGKARQLFEADYFFAPDLSVQYDLEYPGRKRFLMMKELSETRTTKLIYVDNWFEELRRRSPDSRAEAY